MIGSSQTQFKIRPPALIADSATESSANNAIASGYQKGYSRPALAAKAGLSVNARDRMRAAQNEASGIAEGAKMAAGIRAEDQAFNSQAQFDNEMLRQQAAAFDYGQMTDMNGALFDGRMARMNALSGVEMARRRAAMQLRMALLGRGL